MEVIEGKEFHVMTEETANELAKAFEEVGNAINGFGKSIVNTTTTIFNRIKSSIEKDVEHYTKKVETSCFITRWWYKRKLQKAKCRLVYINEVINEYNANRRSDKSPA